MVAGYWDEWRRLRGSRAERLEAARGNPAHDAVREAVDGGDPSVVDMLVALAEGAPSADDARLVGAGPLEDLLSTHAGRLLAEDGAALVDAIDTAARRSLRFRSALAAAYLGDEVPAAVKARLARFTSSPRSPRE